MSLSRKLYLCFGVLFLSMVILAAVTFVSFNSMQGIFDTAVNRRAVILQLAGQYETDIWTLRAAQRGVLLYTYGKNPEAVRGAKELFTKTVADAEAALTQIISVTKVESVKEDARQQKAVLDVIRGTYTEFERLADKGDLDGATQLGAGKLAQAFGNGVSSARKMVDSIKAALKQDQQAGASSAAASRWTATAVALFGAVVGVVAFFVVRRASNTLGQLSRDLAEGAEQVASAAVQVSSSSQSLAQGASEQAASLEETSSSTEEINSMTRKNAENSENSAKLMGDMAEQVREGNRKLSDMVTSMNEINTSSEKISKIIKTIDEIAFQTNILALNAAVEAARAGEAGMGFAVVADEVRSLAQRCAQAAKDTASLIEDSVTKSQEGSRKLEEVAKAIGAITADAEKVKTLVDEVHVGSQEQARGLEQISKAVSQMDQVTQKAAANAEESAAAGEELNAQADTMRSVVGHLVTLVGASGVGVNASATKLRLSRDAGEPSAERRSPVAGLRESVGKRAGIAMTHQQSGEFPLEESSKEI